MPVSDAFARSNRAATDRLRALVKRADRNMLAVRLPNGWTVAGALVHIAFWDRARLMLMRRWAAGEPASGADDGNVFNDAASPLWELIPPEMSARTALAAAEEIDAFLLEVPTEVVDAALARADAPNLDRGEHRSHHLDIVDRALAEAGYA